MNKKIGTEYNFRRFNAGGLVLAVLLLAGLSASYEGSAAPLMKVTPDGGYGTPITPPTGLPEIELTDEQGNPMQLADLTGHPTLLFFGFTHCPHICPTTLSMLRGIRGRLPESVAEQLQVWLISVDPMRDSPEQLKTYLANFGAGFHGATADLGVLVPLFQQLGIGYSYKADEQGGGYDVGHTTTIFLLNNEARLSRVYTAPHDVTELLGSLSSILN
ncbi:MAG: SCO family protein [Immundisolibacteraceae bacterium]|nr:SCO family protein [Immundisolibacteraceae bacterium]